MHSQFPEDDLYDLLGVDAKASTELIRQAYRKLAMTWHPDRNTSHNAEHTFKRILFAYDILRDSQRRKDYDRHAAVTPRSKNTKPPEPEPEHAAPPNNNRAANLSRRAKISLHEQLHGCKVKLKVTRTEYCQRCDGSGHSKAAPVTCGKCKGSGEVSSPLGLFSFFSAGTTSCDGCGGTGKVRSPCSSCQGTGVDTKKTGHLRFDVPAGIRPGTNLRVRGHGRRGRTGEAAGDLLVRIDIAEHPLFAPDFPHLRCEMPINIFRALAGGDIEGPTLDAPLSIPLQADMLDSTELRINGQGMLDGSTGERGDLLLKLRMSAPQKFSKEQRALLAELERSAANDPAQREWQRRLRSASGVKRSPVQDEDRE